MAEDAYVENPTPTITPKFKAYATGLWPCMGDNWSSNVFDDDLNWAIIAFIRAYSITGTNGGLTMRKLISIPVAPGI